MSKATGNIEILLNGVSLLNKAGAKASGIGISGQPNYELKEIMGDGGIHGFTEEAIPAMCEVTLTDRDDISLSDIAKVLQDGTLIFKSRNGGKIYTMAEATCTRNLSVTGGEGETPVKFLASFWTEDKS